MSGGKITRITGGTHIIECENWTVYTNKFTMYAGKQNIITAEKGIKYGNNPEDPPAGEYFVKGWWSFDFEGKKKTVKAKIGDIIYFQIEMTEKFPNYELPSEVQKKIYFKLYEFNGIDYVITGIYSILTPIPKIETQTKKDKEIKYVTWQDINKNRKLDPEEEFSSKPYTEIEAIGNKAVIAFQLNENLLPYFNEFSELKLFMSVTYDNENIDLPEYDTDYLDVKPKLPVIKEIYVKLLNYYVPQIENLTKIKGYVQSIKGNDEFMSEKVNMDYFSVRIDKLPKFAENNILFLYKKIRENFLTLSKGSVQFETYSKKPIYTPNINGNWEFKPYEKKDEPQYAKEQLRKWKYELGNAVFFIEAGGGFVENLIGDHGAVLESETKPYEMCWIFTTIFTKNSNTQPFSGHRQFGIHKDEDGNYRFFARAIDRIWPSEDVLILSDKYFAVKDYLTIADSTWKNLIKNVSEFINTNGGSSTIMPPEIVRTDFNEFLKEYNSSPVTSVGNIPQYKEIQKNEL